MGSPGWSASGTLGSGPIPSLLPLRAQGGESMGALRGSLVRGVGGENENKIPVSQCGSWRPTGDQFVKSTLVAARSASPTFLTWSQAQ
ncbi:MAG: hypothetical protein DMG06_23450 [Acidobacteria bacterium]|nr:MAG: hypothetical protein DMG06_23450 [Acidobacteriota bacterium]